MSHTNPLHAVARLNQRSLSVLARAILLARGQFALILVRCNYEQLQQKMAQDLKQELARQSENQASVSEVFLPASTATLFTTLLVAVEAEAEQQCPSPASIAGTNGDRAQPSALMVFGLESVLELDRVLAATNQAREEFRLAFPFPVAIWMTDEVLHKLTRFAPDFKSWASAALKFDLPLDEAIALWWEESARLFQELLAAGAGRFLSNAELGLAPADRRRRELEFARGELLESQTDSFPAIEAIRAFLLGRDAYGDRAFDRALRFYEQSLDFWLQGPEYEASQTSEELALGEPSPRRFHPFSEQRGLLWYHIGLCHCHLSRLDPARSRQCWQQARSCFSAALKIFTEKNRPAWRDKLTVELGQILQQLEDWNGLEALAREVLSQNAALHSLADRARAYGFLARAALARGRFKPAKYLSSKALVLHGRERHDEAPLHRTSKRQAEALYLLSLARASSALEEQNSALEHLERARGLLAPEMTALTADSLEPFGEKEAIYLDVLERLRSLYFQQQQYELAFELKQEQHAIERACGLKAFYGVVPLTYPSERPYPRFGSSRAIDAPDRSDILASGRQQDVERLLERLRRSEHKLTVVHGASGAGKSSLLHAGLVPALWNEIISARDVLPVLQTTYNDWQQGLSRALTRSLERQQLKTDLHEDIPIFFSRTTILEYLQRNAGSNWLPVLIFDQFEEFFFHCPHSSERREFYRFLGDVLSIPFVKVILCLREDDLHELLTMEREIDWGAVDNDLLDRHIRYALEDLSSDVARRTIEALAARSRFPLEGALIERLVGDIASSQGTVRPIELQVVGGALQAEKITTLDQYEQLGPDPKTVLAERWLQAAIADCGPENEEAVWQVLFALTDVKGLRPLKTKAELLCLSPTRVAASKGEGAIARAQLDLILKILVGSGLVSRLREESENRYQLVHAYLVQRIRSSYSDRTSKAIATQLRSNKVELVRARKQRVRALAIGGVCAVLASIAVFSSVQTEIQRRRALGVSLNAELMALSSSSEALFASNQQFEALLEGLRAMKKLERAEAEPPSFLGSALSENRPAVTTDTRFKVLSILEQAVYGTLERNRFEGHSDVVWGVSFSPDGRRIATASLDKTIKVWEPDGRLLATLWGHQDSVTSVDIAPDRWMVSSSWDGTVRLWRADGTPARVFKADRGRVYSARFSPDGRRLLGAGADGTVKIWTRDGQIQATLKGHQGEVNWATFSPDGQRVASAGKDGALRLWTSRGELLKATDGHQKPVNYVAFSPQGDAIATASDDRTVKLWSRDGQLLATFSGHQGSVHAVGFSPDGRQVVSASDDNTIALWDRSGKRLKTLRGHSDRVTGASFSPDGTMLVSSSFDKTVKLWALEGRTRTILRGHRDRLKDIAFSPDGRWVATASKDKTVKLWTRQGKLKATLEGHRDSVFAASFSPDGRFLATASRDNTIKLWDCQGNFLKTLEGHRDWVIDVQWSPDSQHLASASRDRTVKLWTRQGELLQTLKGHRDRVNAVAFSADGRLLATASDDRTAKLWQRSDDEAETFKPEPEASLEGHGNWILDVSFLPETDRRAPLRGSLQDRPLLATASYDNTVKFWDARGQEVSTLKGHIDSIADLSFNPTGELLATATWSNQIQLWRLDDTLLETLDGHRDRVTSVSWSHDGNALATASEDRTAILWNLDPETLTAMACNWLRDYIRHSHRVRRSDRALCASKQQTVTSNQ